MTLVSIRSVNFPDRFVRHRDYLGELTEVVSDLDRVDATFDMVRGFADHRLLSFGSVNFPGYYLRQESLRLKLRPPPHDPVGGGPTGETIRFAGDATFLLKPGLTDLDAFSFESYTFDGYFMRHSAFHLFIGRASPSEPPGDFLFKLVPGFV